MTTKSDATERNLASDEWSPMRVEYAYWLIHRQAGETQQEWASAHGVSEFTVARWKQHPEVAGLLADWKQQVKGDFALASINMLRLAQGKGPQAVSAYQAVARVLGENAPEKVDLGGRMGLMEWLGSTQPEALAKRN